MSIQSLYNITFTIQRLQVLGVQDNYVTISTSNNGVIRPIARASEILTEANFTKESRLFCNIDTNIAVGDRIIIDISGKHYSVSGIQKFEDIEALEDSHLEVRIYEK